jgi:hypothetical protein
MILFGGLIDQQNQVLQWYSDILHVGWGSHIVLVLTFVIGQLQTQGK